MDFGLAKGAPAPAAVEKTIWVLNRFIIFLSYMPFQSIIPQLWG